MLKKLILASGSWGRRELMRFHGYEFEVRPSQIPEPTEAEDGDIRRYVADLAWRKAAAVAPSVSDGIVIAADTVGWQQGKVVGKPEDEADARRIITALSGTTHELWTGTCVWVRPGDFHIGWQEISEVAMVALSAQQIDDYLKTRKWEGCSGAYAIEMPHDPYISVVKGSVSNVIGLPMESLAKVLRWIEAMAE